MGETNAEVRYECAANPKGCPTVTVSGISEKEPACCGQPMKKAEGSDSCGSKSSCCG